MQHLEETYQKKYKCAYLTYKITYKLLLGSAKAIVLPYSTVI